MCTHKHRCTYTFGAQRENDFNSLQFVGNDELTEKKLQKQKRLKKKTLH